MVDYDPFSEQVILDPHPVYRRLREESPVHPIEKYGCWALSRFQDIWEASADARSYTTQHGTTVMQFCTKELAVFPSLNTLDPPLHTTARAQVRRFFMPSAVAALEPDLRSYAAGLVEALLPQGRIDAVADLAAPVAIRVACLVNGFPLRDAPRLSELVRRYFRREPGIRGMPPDALGAAQEIPAYLEELVHERRAGGERREDSISAYLALELDGRRLRDDEIAAHLTLLLIGAAETFPKVFASALLRLWEHPEQRARVVRDPGLAGDAFHETLRYDMPTQHLGRTLVRDVVVRGQRMRAGQPVLFLYASGNRDEEEFEDPDVFDIERRAPRILSFGHGIHRCLGANVAAMEGRVLLQETLARIPDYEVDLEGAQRLWTEFVQGFARLPIEFSPR